MTQDVQPLTWSKRTNIEEHQQFFSKINEIIGNLAPTVDEAEQAIAQATAAIASANDAVATANAASAAASAAASQAQTAASAVAGYDGRLTAAEGDIGINTADITALQGRMGTAEGKITAIEGRESGYLKKTGAAQTVTSQIMVPTTATGLRDTQIVNGTRIQNDLAAYEPMIRNTGNQSKMGIFTVPEIRQRSYYSTKHVVQVNDAAVGTYCKVYTAKLTSGTDRNGLIMWNNTRKGLPSQNRECGIISIGARLNAVQIASIAGTVPSNHFAITRKVNGDNDVDVAFWATGQIKVYDILFESIGYNNVDVWAAGDLAAITDFSEFDEVVYL